MSYEFSQLKKKIYIYIYIYVYIYILLSFQNGSFITSNTTLFINISAVSFTNDFTFIKVAKQNKKPSDDRFEKIGNYVNNEVTDNNYKNKINNNIKDTNIKNFTKINHLNNNKSNNNLTCKSNFDDLYRVMSIMAGHRSYEV